MSSVGKYTLKNILGTEGICFSFFCFCCCFRLKYDVIDPGIGLKWLTLLFKGLTLYREEKLSKFKC